MATTHAAAFNVLGSKTSAVTNGAGGTAVSTLLPAGKTVRHMIMNVQSSGARWTADGTAPTVGAAGTAIGQPVIQDATISFMDPNYDYSGVIQTMKIIGNPSNIWVDCVFFD